MATQLYSKIDAASRMMGEKGDCAVVAVSVACGVSYKTAHAVLQGFGRFHGSSTYQHQIHGAIDAILKPRGLKIDRGYGQHLKQFEAHKASKSWRDTKNLTVAQVRKEPGIWQGRWIVYVVGHVLSVVDGEVHDWTAGRSHRIISCHKIIEI